MKKYTWLWDATQITSTRGNDILSFCRRMSVDVLYLQWSRRVAFTDYQNFIGTATSLGIRVHACLGEREWYNPFYYNQLLPRLLDLEMYQLTSQPQYQFTGVHFDIEPHSLPEWKTDQVGTVEKWKETVTLYAPVVKKMGIELSAAVPFAIANVPGANGEPLSKFMMWNHDKIVVMAYRDFAIGPDSIMDHVQDFLHQADQTLLPDVVVIAVETRPSSEGAKVSFAEDGRLVMEKELRTVDYFGRQHLSYAGQGIHAVTYWMDMEP